MNLSDLMLADVAEVFLQTEDFASVCRRYRNGERSDSTEFTGVVTLPNADYTDAGGKGQIQRATLVCSADQGINQRDAIVHDGVKYSVLSVSLPEHGMVTVDMQVADREIRGWKQLRTGDL